MSVKNYNLLKINYNYRFIITIIAEKNVHFVFTHRCMYVYIIFLLYKGYS